MYDSGEITVYEDYDVYFELLFYYMKNISQSKIICRSDPRFNELFIGSLPTLP